ncbi:MAG: bifunctional diguanylate cyclase/phosphodiesterase [Hydrogenothermaceae bacterium]|nr:bifunctional diguanylate cyclase/phosphodiesterase [Hydrogenothermaceae bacterium]
MLKLFFRELLKGKISIGVISFSLIVYISFLFYLPNLEKKLHKLIVDRDIENIDTFSVSVLNTLSKHYDRGDYKILTDILETLNVKDVKYVFIVSKSERGYRVLIDASKNDRLPPGSPIQLLPEEENILQNVYTTKDKVVLNHENIDTIGITIYRPFIKDGEILGVLIVDFSTRKLKEISQLVHNLKNIIIFIVAGFLLSLNAVIISVLKAVYHRKKSRTDSLTGLYNRTFLEDLEYTMNLSNYVVAVIDVDFFKKINDTYGHEVGDIVLKEVAKILKNNIRSEDYLIRYGGEEFLLFIRKNREDINKTINGIERIRSAVENEKIYINEKNYIKVTISIGVNLSTEKMKDIDEAIKKADVALYRAKGKGRNRIEIYDEERDTKEATLKISQIKKALEEGRVISYYQPIVNLKTGEYTHLEALARIVGEDGSLIQPYMFINVIENTFLYTQLTKQIVEYNFKVLTKYRDLKVSINLKPADIINQSTIDYLIELSSKYPDIAGRMLLEIVETEDALMYEQIIKNIHSLKERGYKICIDDFGSGYSNFVYLLRLNVDYLKLDANLIKNIDKDKISQEVVKMIVQFCKKMKITVIAEFVENESILETLNLLGIEYGQGYLFSKPQPLEKFIK